MCEKWEAKDFGPRKGDGSESRMSKILPYLVLNFIYYFG